MIYFTKKWGNVSFTEFKKDGNIKKLPAQEQEKLFEQLTGKKARKKKDESKKATE